MLEYRQAWLVFCILIMHFVSEVCGEDAHHYTLRAYHHDRSRSNPNRRHIHKREHSARTDSQQSLPFCALDCEGLEEIDWENDRESCAYFARKGYDCLADCSPNERIMGGVSARDVPRQCHWVLLGCPDLLFTTSPTGPDGDFCPDICEHTECLKTYEKLLVTKRSLDLHRRCAMNCRGR